MPCQDSLYGFCELIENNNQKYDLWIYIILFFLVLVIIQKLRKND
ncbi:MAG: hypothetical protein OQK82_03470 [Candidatus Pacearchaeota archaeon]|nr:hypothetical protein [Candidatus Pacearchaeota archaeon]